MVYSLSIFILNKKIEKKIIVFSFVFFSCFFGELIWSGTLVDLLHDFAEVGAHPAIFLFQELLKGWSGIDVLLLE
jgi:hypothetical protein